MASDDRKPLAEEGRLEFMIRTAIAQGAEPLAAYRAASISAARAFRLHDRGLWRPAGVPTSPSSTALKISDRGLVDVDRFCLI